MNDRQFGQLVDQYEKLVYTICYQFTRNHHTAQDLAQETFLSAHTHRAACPAGNEKPWLARIATNKAKDFLKSAYNRRVQAADDTTLPETANVLYIRQALPEDLTISDDETARIAGDIRALKEPYHQVAVLYFLEEQTVEEIAHRLERPPKTVHTQLWRARRMLQQKLKGGGPE
ncbi:MAG: sigma-70 family RNA polymerase sigma factor [Ruminococcaceae bacterium]|nr:sigma-70 family RNA polymerase sigma factor [Oscillospiraceae bacterium]